VTQRIAIVTGANRGIGYEICKQLAQHGDQVVLTSRDAAKGSVATEQLRAFGAVDFYALDVTNADSIAQLKSAILKKYGRVDVLVNNAAVLIDDDVSIFDVSLDVVRQTFESNVYGVLRMCQAFVPLMLENGYGRVVNVSSEMGQLSDMGSRTSAYRMSKTTVNAITTIFAREITQPNVKINACCPGWVRTDMGGPSASKSIAEGADTPVWLACLSDDAPSGGFFADRQRIAW
jgi:NAD(P)-dependent dehydrogenase (short-subunit alcohol dehydrogenase family)